MILRLGTAAALHGAAGVAMGVTTVLAACTVAQVAKVAVEDMRSARDPFATPPGRPGGP